MLMTITTRIAIAVLVSLQLSAAAAATEPVRPFHITYKVQTDYLTVGSATLSLQQIEASTYKLQLKTEPAAFLKFSGKGLITETAQLASLRAPFAAFRYDYRLHGTRKKSYTAHIDHERNTARIEQHRNTRELAFESPVHDRLSITLEIISLLTQQPNLSKIEFNVLDAGSIRQMSYSNEGRESVTVPLGTFEAIRLKRHRAGSNRVTTTWFAELVRGTQSQLMPIKIEQYKKGKLSLRLLATTLSKLE